MNQSFLKPKVKSQAASPDSFQPQEGRDRPIREEMLQYTREPAGWRILKWTLSIAVCILLILSTAFDGTQYLSAKLAVQTPTRLLTGMWVWSTFHWFFTLLVLCVLNVLLVCRLVRFLRDPRQNVRLLALTGLVLQFITIVASALLLDKTL